MLDLNAHLTWENFIKVVEVSQIEESCFTCPICFALKRGQLHQDNCTMSNLANFQASTCALIIWVSGI
jgi:hypothetical protein